MLTFSFTFVKALTPKTTMTLHNKLKYFLGLAMSLSLLTNTYAQVDTWTWNTSSTDSGVSVQGDNVVVEADYVTATHIKDTSIPKLWRGTGSANAGDFILRAKYYVENLHDTNTGADMKVSFGGTTGRLEFVHNTSGSLRCWHSGGTGNNYNLFNLGGDARPSTTDGYMMELIVSFDSDSSTITIEYSVDDAAPVLAFRGATTDSQDAGVVAGTKGQNGFGDDIITGWAKFELFQYGNTERDAANGGDLTQRPEVQFYSYSLEPADLVYGGVPYVAPADPWLITDPADAAVIEFSEDFTAAYADENGDVNSDITYTMSGNYTQDAVAGEMKLTDLHNSTTADTAGITFTEFPAGTTEPKWFQPIQVTEIISTPLVMGTGDNPDTTGPVQVEGVDYVIEDIDISTGTVTIGEGDAAVTYVVPDNAVAGDPLEAVESADHEYVSQAEVRTEYIGDFKYSITYRLDEHRDPQSGTDVKISIFGNDGFLQLVHNSFGDVRLWHANSGMGINGNIVPNTRIDAFVDGAVITWNIYYQVDYDVIGVEYSVDGGTPVAYFGGAGNGGMIGDVISNFAELSLFKWGSNPIEALPEITIISASLGATLDTTDTDGDGLTDIDELTIGTDPNLEDSDGDSLGDLAEIDIIGSDPTVADTALIEYLEGVIGGGGTDPVAVPEGSVSLSANGDNFDLVFSIKESSDLTTFSTMDITDSNVTVDTASDTVTISIDGSSDKAFFRTSAQ